jgi:hypothetical protein
MIEFVVKVSPKPEFSNAIELKKDIEGLFREWEKHGLGRAYGHEGVAEYPDCPSGSDKNSYIRQCKAKIAQNIVDYFARKAYDGTPITYDIQELKYSNP